MTTPSEHQDNLPGPEENKDTPLARFLMVASKGGCLLGAMIIGIGIIGVVITYRHSILHATWSTISGAIHWLVDIPYIFTGLFSAQVIALVIHVAAFMTCREYRFWKKTDHEEKNAKRWRATVHVALSVFLLSGITILLAIPPISLHVYASLMYYIGLYTLCIYTPLYFFFRKYLKG